MDQNEGKQDYETCRTCGGLGLIIKNKRAKGCEDCQNLGYYIRGFNYGE